MNAATLRLTGVVSDPPAEVDPVRRELREVLAENERLYERNKRLKHERDAARDRVAEMEAGVRLVWTPEPGQPALTLGRLKLNLDLRLMSLDGREVYLSTRCLEMVAYLMARPDRVVTSGTLAKALDHANAGPVRTLMGRVRFRLAEIGAGAYLRSNGRSWSSGGYWMSASGEKA